MHVSFWMRKEDEWIIHTIRKVQKSMDEKGIRLSKNDVFRIALEEFLKKFRVEEEQPLLRLPKRGKISYSRNIYIRREDYWIVECVDKIVKTKKESGINTNFEFELLRLAKAGLLRNLIGAELDKEILQFLEKKIGELVEDGGAYE